MRIRKRQVPLPLSSLSPIPLSDPLFLLPPPNSKPPPPPPPPPPQIDPRDQLPADYYPEEEKDSSNYHSSGPDNAAENTLAGSSSAAEAVKRRSLSSNDDDDDDDVKEYKWDVKMKGSSSGNNSGKRRGRGGVGVGGGGANAEGSRCSRVNGRGWRCGQLTLVGYSLCEHHLGKGRLRSMASVRGRPPISMMETPRNEDETPQQTPGTSLISGTREGNTFLGDNEEEDEEKEEEEEEDSKSTGPRKKARSMSSLLGQVSNQDDNVP